MNAKSHKCRMGFRHGIIGMIVKVDRLSSLPDDLIHKILSFISLTQAIELSVLSSRWRFIWTSLPYLNFNEPHSSPHSFKFVSNALSQRNNQTQVYSIKITFSSKSFKQILNYTFSHNVQQLSVSFFSSSIIMTSIWNLPALKTLHLDGITLCDDNTNNCVGFLSMCTNLENLSLGGFKVRGTNDLTLSHPRISNLTLEHTHLNLDLIKVVAPQLKNLNINHFNGKHLMISAPGLTSLVIKGCRIFQLIATQGFPSLEKVDLCFINTNPPYFEDPLNLVCVLQQSVKFLTLNLDILECFSSMRVMAPQSSPFANLKISKFSMTHPIRVYLEVGAQEKLTTSTEIKNYDQLDTSPSAICTIVSSEEIRLMRNIVSAQELVPELCVLLKQRKSFCDANREQPIAPMVSCRAQVNMQWTQSASEMQSYLREMMPHFKQSKMEEHMQSKIEELLTKLKHIEGLLTKLPASKRPAMQAPFCIVCDEAAIVTGDMLKYMKIRYIKKPKRSIV
ncbi:unnamed protein product [Lactuca virosa]|uniref:F-box domain-containing protein n=1 Tax=Lactuca virosa TaxID=75947 RepID=A0AAU9M2L4_9ASTR|nr:unnamed protein product [Lactuca virosa]